MKEDCWKNDESARTDENRLWSIRLMMPLAAFPISVEKEQKHFHDLHSQQPLVMVVKKSYAHMHLYKFYNI